MKVLRVLALGLAVAALAGCASDPNEEYFRSVHSKANVYVAPVPSDIERVALMPFKAPTELIGASVSDMFVTELLRAGRYTLVERSQMAKVLSESELALAGLSESKAVEVGNMMGADGVIIGTVDEYSAVAQKGKVKPVVGLSVRLIDCRNSKVMWSSDLAEAAAGSNATLAEEARRVVHQIAAGLYQRLSVQRKVPRSSGAPAVNLKAAVGRTAPSAVPAVPSPAAAMAPSPQSQPWSASSAGTGTLPAVGTGTAGTPGAGTGAPPTAGTGTLAAAPVSNPPVRSADAFTVSDMGLREVTLRWTVPPGAAAKEYRIDRAEKKEGPFVPVARIAPAKKEFTDGRTAPLKDGTTYYYRLVALSADGAESAPSMVRESMTAPPPDPPGSLRAEAPAPRTVRLAWKAPASEGVARYRIERSATGPTGVFARVTETEGLTFQDGGPAAPLKDGAGYAYRLSSINRVGATSAPSAPVEVATRPPPAAVDGLAAVAGELKCIPLSWKPSSEEDVARYNVYAADAPDGKFTLLGTVNGRTKTAFLDGGANPGTLPHAKARWYKVAAVNAAGVEGTWSAVATAATHGAPPAVAGLKAEAGLPREVRLSWSAAEDRLATGYELQRRGGENRDFARLVELKGRDKTAFADRGAAPKADGIGALADGVEYAYRIRATSATELPSPWSAEVKAQTRPVPAAPEKIAAEFSPGSVTLSWQNPDPARVVAYRVWKKGAREPLARVEKPGHVLGFALVGDGLPVTVTALDRDGLESRPSAPLALDECPPPVPAGLTATTDGLREVVLRWKAPADNAKFYRVERAAAAEGPFAALGKADPADATYRDAGAPGRPLEDTATYCYRLVAVAANQRESAPGETVRAATAPPPAAPPALKAEAPAARAARVTWTPSPAAGVVKYVVERATGDAPEAFAKAGVVETPEFREGGTAESPLQDRAKYLYRVTAVNRVGSVGPPSEAVEVTMRPPPAVVAGFAARGGEVRCVPLSWTASPETDVVRYDLYRRDGADGEFAKLTSIQGRERTKWLDGGADPGQLADEHRYEYRIRAINAVTSESADSEIAAATTRPVPPAPAGLKAKGGVPRETPIAWTASPDEKTIGYEIRRAADEGAAPVVIGRVNGRETTAYTDRGPGARSSGLGTLRDGAEYRYVVAAFNTAQALSAPSEPVVSRTKPAPATPAGLTATTNVAHAVRLAWKPNPETDIATYVVEVAERADGRFREAGRATPTAEDQLSFAHREQPDGEPRCYRVKAIDRDTLESAWSEVAPGQAKARPGVPSELKAEWKDGGAVLIWTPPPQPDIKQYKIWKKSFFGAEAIATAEVAEGRLTAAQVDGKATVFVTAVDADGLESDRSAPVEIRAPAP